jgi:hypothetical protein
MTTHPIDIERALKNDYSQDPHKRDLQFEAKAHIAVQEWIDRGGVKGGLAITADGVREIHRRFCELLPEDLLWVEDLAGKQTAHARCSRGKPRRDQRGRPAPLPGALCEGVWQSRES